MAHHAPLPMAAGHGARAATRGTLLDLIAEVMEASFQTLGQGVIMGSMPAILRRFGMHNARYVHTHYQACDASRGAVSALGPSNFVSSATGTAYTTPVADASRAVKRLQACEFQTAFLDKSDFAKAMVCRLHEAVYEGSVNGLLADPKTQGYRVALQQRILFGGTHCDFQVDSIPERTGDDPGVLLANVPTGPELEGEQHHFYAAILVAFVEYLCQVLPEADVQAILADCADRVGARIGPMLAGTTPLDRVEDLLTKSDRRAEADATGVSVTACPFVRPIKGVTNHLEHRLRDGVRRIACGSCVSLLQGAVEETSPGAVVRRLTCLVADDASCRFEVGGVA